MGSLNEPFNIPLCSLDGEVCIRRKQKQKGPVQKESICRYINKGDSHQKCLFTPLHTYLSSNYHLFIGLKYSHYTIPLKAWVTNFMANFSIYFQSIGLYEDISCMNVLAS